MTRITRAMCAMGLAAAFVASTAGAQQTGTDTTTVRRDTARTTGATSTQRIPVRKDRSYGTQSTTSTGAVAGRDTTMRDTSMMRDTTMMHHPTMHDTSMMRDTTMRDTTMMGRDTTGMMHDTTTMTTDTVATTTTTTTEPLPTATGIGIGRGGMFGNGFYIGIAGGGTMPTGDFADAYNTGWNVTVPIGWQSMTTPWGARLDLSFNKINGDTFGGTDFEDGNIWSAMLDLTAQWPVGGTGTGFYLVGGGGVHHFRDFDVRTSSTTTTEFESETKFGWNGGAGISFGFGSTDLFVEARYVNVFTDGPDAQYVPIVLGLRFF